MDAVEVARSMAEGKLADALPRRWKHAQAVAAKAQRISYFLSALEKQALVSAAWLHDVGYARDLALVGFHALDGARWLRSQSFNERVAGLVAHHSCARFEAEERGLAVQLNGEFVDEETAARDALWYADMTTGPDGQDFDVLERLAEIRSRYGPDHLVTRFWERAEPTLLAAVRRTEERLANAGVQPM